MDVKPHDLFNYLQESSAIDWNQGLYYTCHHDRIDMVELMIKHGANAINRAMRYTCQYGHIEIVKLLIGKSTVTDVNTLNLSLSEACYAGHIEIVKLLIENGASNLNKGFCEALLGNRMNIVAFLIEKGEPISYNITLKQKQQILDIGIDISFVIHDDEFKMLIKQQHALIEQAKKITDEILHNIYKNKQIYDKNILNIVCAYAKY